MVQETVARYDEFEAAGILLYISYEIAGGILTGYDYISTNYDVAELDYYTYDITWTEQGPHMVVVDLEDMVVLASDAETTAADALNLCRVK